MKTYYRDFLIRDWEPGDRITAAEVIGSVLSEYGLPWEPRGADRYSSNRQFVGQKWKIKHNCSHPVCEWACSTSS